MAVATTSQRSRQGELIARPSLLQRLYRQPEVGALAAGIIMWILFAVAGANAGFASVSATAAWLNTAAMLGIVAVPVGLLLIAGEFDLSVGSVVGASAITVGACYQVFHLPFLVGVLIAIVIGVLVGLGNSLLLTRTGLPSFIVTLGFNYILLGLALGGSRLLTGTSSISVSVPEPWHSIFGATFGEFSVTILWWLAICLVGTWVLQRTRFGNWILATGGNPDGARRAGVPVNRVKTILFICVSISGVLVGVLSTTQFSTANAASGQALVFQAPIVVVIGGVLLFGGYGTVLGIVFGAMTFGIVSIGLYYTGWSTDWVSAFIGTLLILAVIANNGIRKLALSGGRKR